MPNSSTIVIAPAVEAPRRQGLGPLSGSLILFFVLLIGAMYFWGKYLNDTDPVIDTSTAHTISGDTVPTNLQRHK